MCLDRKIRLTEKKYFRYEKHDGYSIGYKIYKGKKRNQIRLTPTNNGRRQPVDQWINEKDVRNKHYCNDIVYSVSGSTYPTGFHFYPNLETARTAARRRKWGSFQIRKIYFERACSRGIQSRLPVVVSKNIYISED